MLLRHIPRRVAVILSTMILALTASATTAHAAALAAYDCPTGNVCVYSGFDGTGSRCNWSDADNNWYAAPVVCSWAAGTNVRSYYNHGQSTSYVGVLLYYNTGYQNLWTCARQGSRFSFIQGISDGVRLASHRWSSTFPSEYCS